MFKACVTFAITSLVLVATAQGTLITGVTIQDVSSEIGPPFERHALHTIDGSGLNINGPGTHSNSPDGTMWLNAGTGLFNSSADNAPQITWNLGALYIVGNMRVWNYNENSGNAALFTLRGINTTDIYTSINGSTYSFLSSVTLNQAPGSDTVDFSQLVPLNTVAQYVRFTNIAAFAGHDNGFVGLSEVQFNSVPEPASLVLFGLGAIGLFLAARRRRKA